MSVFKQCRFFSHGNCVHKDAPPDDRHCIGLAYCGASEDDFNENIAKEFKGLILNGIPISKDEFNRIMSYWYGLHRCVKPWDYLLSEVEKIGK